MLKIQWINFYKYHINFALKLDMDKFLQISYKFGFEIRLKLKIFNARFNI